MHIFCNIKLVGNQTPCTNHNLKYTANPFTRSLSTWAHGGVGGQFWEAKLWLTFVSIWTRSRG